MSDEIKTWYIDTDVIVGVKEEGQLVYKGRGDSLQLTDEVAATMVGMLISSEEAEARAEVAKRKAAAQKAAATRAAKKAAKEEEAARKAAEAETETEPEGGEETETETAGE